MLKGKWQMVPKATFVIYLNEFIGLVVCEMECINAPFRGCNDHLLNPPAHAGQTTG